MDPSIEVLAPVDPANAGMLSPEALAFVADLHRQFNRRRHELLRARAGTPVCRMPAFGSAIVDTLIGAPLSQAPAPTSPLNVSPMMKQSTTPRIGAPPFNSAIDTAQCG